MFMTNTLKGLDLGTLISVENRTNGTLSTLIRVRFKEKPPAFQVGPAAVFIEREKSSGVIQKNQGRSSFEVERMKERPSFMYKMITQGRNSRSLMLGRDRSRGFQSFSS